MGIHIDGLWILGVADLIIGGCVPSPPKTFGNLILFIKYFYYSNFIKEIRLEINQNWKITFNNFLSMLILPLGLKIIVGMEWRYYTPKIEFIVETPGDNMKSCKLELGIGVSLSLSLISFSLSSNQLLHLCVIEKSILQVRSDTPITKSTVEEVLNLNFASIKLELSISGGERTRFSGVFTNIILFILDSFFIFLSCFSYWTLPFLLYLTFASTTMPSLISKHVSQVPFCCGLAQVLVGPDDQLLAESNFGQLTNISSKHSQIKQSHFYLSLFLACIILFQRTPHLCLLFVCSAFIPLRSLFDILSSTHLSSPSTLSLLSSFSSSPVFQGYLPVPQCLTRRTRFLISVSTALVFTTNTKILSPQCGTITKSAACLHSFSQANSPQTPQTRIPIKSPLMPTQTSQITIPLQPSSPRKLVAPSIDQPPLSKFECDIIFLIKWNSTRVTHNLTACHPSCFDMEFGMVCYYYHLFFRFNNIIDLKLLNFELFPLKLLPSTPYGYSKKKKEIVLSTIQVEGASVSCLGSLSIHTHCQCGTISLYINRNLYLEKKHASEPDVHNKSACINKRRLIMFFYVGDGLWVGVSSAPEGRSDRLMFNFLERSCSANDGADGRGGRLRWWMGGFAGGGGMRVRLGVVAHLLQQMMALVCPVSTSHPAQSPPAIRVLHHNCHHHHRHHHHSSFPAAAPHPHLCYSTILSSGRKTKCISDLPCRKSRPHISAREGTHHDQRGGCGDCRGPITGLRATLWDPGLDVGHAVCATTSACAALLVTPGLLRGDLLSRRGQAVVSALPRVSMVWPSWLRVLRPRLFFHADYRLSPYLNEFPRLQKFKFFFRLCMSPLPPTLLRFSSRTHIIFNLYLSEMKHEGKKNLPACTTRVASSVHRIQPHTGPKICLRSDMYFCPHLFLHLRVPFGLRGRKHTSEQEETCKQSRVRTCLRPVLPSCIYSVTTVRRAGILGPLMIGLAPGKTTLIYEGVSRLKPRARRPPKQENFCGMDCLALDKLVMLKMLP
ncbi:putative signal peptide protein [Puccinia sorghi]|uniref:Putative signal peptide protein n=1 Tax=Puccinia sorghi TaxID=27349 RepID=A0A0L6V6Y1_9BASI|nr:putative signal peptide protein [Puccinia sorghi]